MNDKKSCSAETKAPCACRNAVSLCGLILAVASLFAFLLLVLIDSMAKTQSPYLGILTYIVSPAFLVAGLCLIGLGILWQRRRAKKSGAGAAPMVLSLDLSQPKGRRNLALFLVGGLVFLLITSVASYQTYHVTKSVKFCGELCHTVMEPQYVTYQNSPHAQVECTACHIGPGAVNTVKAKLNGLNQVYQTVLNSYSRPLDVHATIKIDQASCEQCHWPKWFTGNLDRTFHRHLDDKDNSLFAVRMMVKVGGSDPTHGPVDGIHNWHMNASNKFEYVATDKLGQKIPWIRFTNAKGEVTEYRSPGFTDDPAKHTVRTMNCMDCHNRPAHHFRAPTDAVDLAIASGRISSRLPGVKRVVVDALTASYEDRTEAKTKIAEAIKMKYSGQPETEPAVAEAQKIYATYFFPEMKTDWSLYPNNIGHKDTPGCFRCHDNDHVSADGKKRIGNDCNSCHVIVAQGAGDALNMLNAKGVPFAHPAEGWENLQCSDCHDGMMGN